LFIPNNSTQRNTAVTGQLVTPQKRQASPTAAPIEQSSPRSGARKLPKVEPTKNTGRISPPLNPAPSVKAVTEALVRISQFRLDSETNVL